MCVGVHSYVRLNVCSLIFVDICVLICVNACVYKDMHVRHMCLTMEHCCIVVGSYEILKRVTMKTIIRKIKKIKIMKS